MLRLPTRTLVLMFFALGAFAWFWWRTHPAPRPATTRIEVVVFGDGGTP